MKLQYESATKSATPSFSLDTHTDSVGLAPAVYVDVNTVHPSIASPLSASSEATQEINPLYWSSKVMSYLPRLAWSTTVNPSPDETVVG